MNRKDIIFLYNDAKQTQKKTGIKLASFTSSLVPTSLITFRLTSLSITLYYTYLPLAFCYWHSSVDESLSQGIFVK